MAPEQEGTPTGGPRASLINTNVADDAQRKTDEFVEKMMNKCGGKTWCNNVVDGRQFEEYPSLTLLAARTIRIMLAVFIVICVVALLTGYFFEGKITTLEEIDQQEFIAAPNIAMCPVPWGGTFAAPLVPVKASLMQVPAMDNVKAEAVNYTETDCLKVTSRLAGCHCFDFSSTILRPHGDRGNLLYIDYIRFEIQGSAGSSALHRQFAFGFYSGGLQPQQWTYGSLGHIIEGDVRFEEVAKGKTEFTEGTTTPRFGFRLAGEAETEGGNTIMVFGYDKYLAYVVSSFGNKYSIFAMMTVLITFCAAINNFGLFEIMFPEKVDDESPAQLQPNSCCSYVFGCCCICCKPRAEFDDEQSSSKVSSRRKSRSRKSATEASPGASEEADSRV